MFKIKGSIYIIHIPHYLYLNPPATHTHVYQTIT